MVWAVVCASVYLHDSIREGCVCLCVYMMCSVSEIPAHARLYIQTAVTKFKCSTSSVCVQFINVMCTDFVCVCVCVWSIWSGPAFQQRALWRPGHMATPPWLYEPQLRSLLDLSICPAAASEVINSQALWVPERHWPKRERERERSFVCLVCFERIICAFLSLAKYRMLYILEEM